MQDEKRGEHDRDEGKLPIVKKEQDENAGGGDEIAKKGDRGAGDEVVDGGRVVDDAGDNAPGLAFLVELEGEFLEVERRWRCGDRR